MLDIKVVGGTIVDGSGAPGFTGDVGIRDGRIVAVGKIDEGALETINASGRVVSPGFIDVHTHYDAQAFWDPTLSPSCYHGVTTVVGGFCGFSIAPLTSQTSEYIKAMLARVEGMPLEVLAAAVPWNWSSFGEFLAKLDGRMGLNAGFFAGHSAIRRVVMGARAVGEKATPDDMESMKTLLGKSLAEGALGFSTSMSPSHVDGDGKPVPSRWADPSEFIELARIVSQHEGTGLELLPDLDFGPGTPELMADFSIAGNRPVNWNVLAITGLPGAEKRAESQLAISNLARERGGEVIALTVPTTPEAYVSLRAASSLDLLPGIWHRVLRMPLAERIENLKSASVRKQMVDDAASVPAGSTRGFFVRFGDYRVVSTRSAANKKYEGRLTGAIAAEDGRTPLNVLLDIAVADDLETILALDLGGHDQATYAIRGRLWADDRTLIGASDAGAHLDTIDTFAFSTTVLQKGVREHKVISLEAAVHQMTQRPARYFGLIDRGMIAPGYHADLVVFDAEKVGRGRTYFRHDLPGDAEAYRVYAEAEGIDQVLVNGVPIVRGGVHTGKLPGTVFRSGKDTRTVPLDVMQNTPRKIARA